MEKSFKISPSLYMQMILLGMFPKNGINIFLSILLFLVFLPTFPIKNVIATSYPLLTGLQFWKLRNRLWKKWSQILFSFRFLFSLKDLDLSLSYFHFYSSSGITKDGFTTFDSTIMQEVLVTGHVLCFLADSPMHAEVTNTPNPGSSLTPCQICHLHMDGIADCK